MKKILTVALLTAVLLTVAAGALAATGLGSVTSVSVAAGAVSVNTTMCAVTIEDGKIVSMSIDVVQPKATVDANGEAANLNAAPQTKKELKEGYGMLKASAIGKEWYEQAEAFEAWCVGKTVDEVLNMKVFDRGDGHHTHVPDEADLLSSVTISVGDYLKALEKAAAAAK